MNVWNVWTYRIKDQKKFYFPQSLISNNKHDKHKLYSCHSPEGECISKGKAHKKYEFGSLLSG